MPRSSVSSVLGFRVRVSLDVSLDFTILDVSTRRYRALMGNTR